MLGAATLAIGAALGAIPANLEFRTATGMFFYLVLPMVGSSTMVAYGLQRRTSMIDASRIAPELLDELPDPDKAR